MWVIPSDVGKRVVIVWVIPSDVGKRVVIVVMAV